MLATACWFGGFWADAEGETGETKQKAIESRCIDVATKVWGSSEKAKIEQLRALDAKAVSDVAAAVEKIAANDALDAPRAGNLSKLTVAVGDAMRELVFARRAGDKVQADEQKKDVDRLSKDEQDAVPALRAHAALDALLKADVGDLGKEAHAIGILTIVDRLNIVRRVPRHLKIYAVGDCFKALFGVDIPKAVSDDVTKPLERGVWVGYLVDVAKAAGHAVPDAAMKNDKDKLALAWAGTLQALADKLDADGAGISPNTELQKVVMVVKGKIGAELRESQKLQPSAPPVPPKK